VAATKLDNVEGNSPEEKKARKRNEMRLYDRRLLEERLKHLREVRERGQISEMMFAVRADLLRNLGNMTNRSVFVLHLSDVGKQGEAVHDEMGETCAWTCLTCCFITPSGRLIPGACCRQIMREVLPRC